MADEAAIITDSPTFLVLSREHQLLPLAHRLRNVEGHTTEAIVWKKSYENAWNGMIDKDLMSSKRELHTESISRLVERANAGEIIVCHDVPSLEHAFDEAPISYPVLKKSPVESPVRLGFWSFGGRLESVHLLVYDLGAWPGGLGRRIAGGATLVAPQGPSETEFLEQAFSAELREELVGFSGLGNVGVHISESGELVLQGIELGWPYLQTQLVMGANVLDWGSIIAGTGTPVFEKTYTVAVPLSVPPWPTNPAAKVLGRATRDLPITLNPKLHSYVYWHDVWVDRENKALFTAGLDGLVGVVHASAHTFEGARQKVLQIASLIQVHEKQFRPDVGSLVPTLLASIEEQFNVVL